MKALTITYLVKNGVYVNLTNRCPCSCVFCLRQNGDGVAGSDSLWLEREPTLEEVCRSLDQWNLDERDEVVFCGYGEPTERLDVLLDVARYIRSKSGVKIRVNTNGLADLIWKEPTARKLEGLVDAVSISLNASDKETYFKLTRSKFGIESYDAMLRYAQDCVKYVPSVVMTIVDVVTSKEEQERCRRICEERGLKLRIRPYEK
ncbi:MAG: TIGR04100 family radical SAM protein [Thermoguttaceae bacterium]|nr:TIGR04100 family radical SAM protein [Thermoguttaceae bacterium]